jgi:phospholipid/cholesterol/gamma-HCH transport system substrate-binding protein
VNQNRQYLFVGLFVLIVTTIIVVIWLWFVNGGTDKHRYNKYQITFHESISGISADSVVKYNGVNIGKVIAVDIDNNDPRNIIVYVKIYNKILISKDTYAVLQSQGLTGLSYIDLRLPPTSVLNSGFLKIHNTPPYPEIKSQISLLSNLTEQAQSLGNDLQNISSQTRMLLSDSNIQHISNTLKNFDDISTALTKKTDTITKSLNELQDILVNVKRDSVTLNNLMGNLQQLSKSTNVTVNNTNKLILDVRDNTVHNLNSVFLPNLNQTVINLNQSSAQLQQLLTLLNQNPSALIRGKSPLPKGPGE